MEANSLFYTKISFKAEIVNTVVIEEINEDILRNTLLDKAKEEELEDFKILEVRMLTKEELMDMQTADGHVVREKETLN